MEQFPNMAEVPASKTSIRILVRDPRPDASRNIHTMLVELGFSDVVIAPDQDVIRSARAAQPDVIVIGAPSALAFRQNPGSFEAKDTPIIFLLPRDAGPAPPAAFGCLFEPVSALELRCAIEMALYRRSIDTKLRTREEWVFSLLASLKRGVVSVNTSQRLATLSQVTQALDSWASSAHDLDRVLALIGGVSQASDDEPVGALPATGESGAPSGQRALAGATVPPSQGVSGSSGRTQTDEELRILNVELERRVADRTRQLEAANKELESFSYSVAHDLRAPLRGIDGMSRILLEDYVREPEATSYLERIRANIKRMGQLIDDLLRLSRITRRELVTQSVDLSRIAVEIVDDLRRTSPREIDFQVAEGAVVEGDQQLLRIVLENLLQNAWKYSSKESRARIEFGVEHRDGPVYFVRDNGVGFDMSRASRLFAAFQRLHSPAEFEGEGVGLAIAQRIINRHGGRIWAESSVGNGATFYFTV